MMTCGEVLMMLLTRFRNVRWTVRAERSLRSKRSRSGATRPSTSALRAHAQGERRKVIDIEMVSRAHLHIRMQVSQHGRIVLVLEQRHEQDRGSQRVERERDPDAVPVLALVRVRKEAVDDEAADRTAE